eukprot:Tamp_24570.p4 GENE.Tamp_24570~~Tamp_24570.p4  ORF type:complete len:107 (+),score=8.19 Tamp_24570:413-733(+)
MMRRPLCLRKRAAQPCGGRRTRYRTAAPSFRAKLIPGGQPLPAACSASRTKDAAGDIPVSIRRRTPGYSTKEDMRIATARLACMHACRHIYELNNNLAAQRRDEAP